MKIVSQLCVPVLSNVFQTFSQFLPPKQPPFPGQQTMAGNVCCVPDGWFNHFKLPCISLIQLFSQLTAVSTAGRQHWNSSGAAGKESNQNSWWSFYLVFCLACSSDMNGMALFTTGKKVYSDISFGGIHGDSVLQLQNETCVIHKPINVHLFFSLLKTSGAAFKWLLLCGTLYTYRLLSSLEVLKSMSSLEVS